MKIKPLVLVLLAVMCVMAAVGCSSSPDNIVEINTPVPGTQAGTPPSSGQINVPGFKVQINAPGPNLLVNVADSQGRIASTLLGIWHGMISPVTLVISFFDPVVQIYEVHNDGSLYNLGFLIGVAIVFFILGISTARRR